ncbi:MAG: hypothetical protein KDD14_00200 [Saprospiraceae bacterium]|nr:hypothetical protein [Saprospiraceae bacterium]
MNFRLSPQPLSGFRQTTLLGTAVYMILLVLAAVFYLERMAVLDMAFQTFQILRTGSLQIQSGRFGAAGTQFFAWAAQAINLPLKAVLYSYSLGHVLYYFLIFLIITLGLRQWKWALVLVLLSTLMTTHTFYWLSEMPQGLAFLILILAWLDFKGEIKALRWWEYPVCIVALIAAFYFHPMVLYAMLFCAMFFFFEKQRSKGNRTLFLCAALIFLITALVKYKVLKLDWYDAMSLERAKAYGALWPHWFAIKSNRDFLQWCLFDYYLVPILTAVNTGFYIWKKQWLKAVLATFAPIGFVLLVNVPFHQGDNQFYLENLYLPLAIFTAVPLIFDVLPSTLPEKRIWLAIAGISALGLLRITLAHRNWSARVNWEQGILEKTASLPNRKLILTEEQAPMDTLILSWGSAYEFLLLSALEHPDSARCLIIDEAAWRFDSLRNEPDLFLGEFKNYPFEALPKRYFNCQDRSGYTPYSPN